MKNLLESIFPKRAERARAEGFFKLLNGYAPVFTSWNGRLYESELVRSAIDARARHISKLNVTATGSARPRLLTLIKAAPNAWQTWPQFFYRLSTILDVRNTAFIAPVLDDYGQLTGYYPIAPAEWELVVVSGEPWIRFRFDNGGARAVELTRVGIMTKFQYESDFFGESNRALRDTMELIRIQRQGIEESAKNSATYRMMAKVSNFTMAKDLAKERKRFDEENFKTGGGMLLLPNTYTDIKQLTQQSYAVDADQLKLIQNNVFTYFGVNEEVLQNKAYGDAFSAFYEGAIEPFAIQASDVMTRMTFTPREQSFGARIFLTANRIQYMSNKDKMDFANNALDRGYVTIDEAREVWNLPPLPDGRGQITIMRGEYYNAATGEKVSGESGTATQEGDDGEGQA